MLTFKNAASKHTALPNILILPECSERRPIILSVTFIFSNNVVYNFYLSIRNVVSTIVGSIRGWIGESNVLVLIGFDSINDCPSAPICKIIYQFSRFHKALFALSFQSDFFVHVQLLINWKYWLYWAEGTARPQAASSMFCWAHVYISPCLVSLQRFCDREGLMIDR